MVTPNHNPRIFKAQMSMLAGRFPDANGDEWCDMACAEGCERPYDDADLDNVLQQAIITLEQDLCALHQELGRGSPLGDDKQPREKRGLGADPTAKMPGGTATTTALAVAANTLAPSSMTTRNREGELRKEMASLEEALGALRSERQGRGGGPRPPRERHGPSLSSWCRHGVLRAGALVLGVEALLCKLKGGGRPGRP